MSDKKVYYKVNFDMYIEQIEVTKIVHDEKSKYFDRVQFWKIELADAFQEYWWSFVQSLWTALINADCINADKLIKTFEEYVNLNNKMNPEILNGIIEVKNAGELADIVAGNIDVGFMWTGDFLYYYCEEAAKRVVDAYINGDIKEENISEMLSVLTGDDRIYEKNGNKYEIGFDIYIPNDTIAFCDNLVIFFTKALSKTKKHAKILYEKYFTVFTVLEKIC